MSQQGHIRALSELQTRSRCTVCVSTVDPASCITFCLIAPFLHNKVCMKKYSESIRLAFKDIHTKKYILATHKSQYAFGP